MSKTIELQFDDESIAKAENILDDIGLDCPTFAKMCFKKLIKEQNISFLTNGNPTTAQQKSSEPIILNQQNIDEGISDTPIRRTKNEITAQMRDYVWDIFKAQLKANKKIDCTLLASLANVKTGINQGSAYIYFLILNNLVAGVPNTRTMKFDDLVVYLSYIKEQLPEIYIANAIKSLRESVPYWEEHIQGYFAQKVSNLISQYK